MDQEYYQVEIEKLQKGAKEQLANNDLNYLETLNQLLKLQSEYIKFLKQKPCQTN